MSVANIGSNTGRRRPLLICLDLQSEVDVDAIPNLPRCLFNCERILRHAREGRWTVAHVYRTKAGPPPSRVALPDLEPLPHEAVVMRPGLSAFSSPMVRQLVADSGAQQIVVIGLSLSSSCLATALSAYDENLAVTLVEDAVAATPLDQIGLKGIEDVARAIAAPFVKMTTTNALIGAKSALRLVHNQEGPDRAEGL